MEHRQPTLTVHDSAPSDYVHKDLRKVIRTFLPEIRMIFGASQVQIRGSDDCGLHMTAHFFAKARGVPIEDGETIATRLRTLCHNAQTSNMPKKKFLKSVCAELARHGKPTTAPTTKTPQSANNTKALSPGPVRRNNRTLQGGGEDARTQNPTQTPHNTPNNSQHTPTRPRRQHTDRTGTPANRDIAGWAQTVLEECRTSERGCATRKIGYFLMAAALRKVGEGSNRLIQVDAVGGEVYRSFGKGAKVQRDVGEALKKMKLRLDLWARPNEDGPAELVPRTDRIETGPLYVRTDAGIPLPSTMGNRVFRLGAKFVGELGPNGATQGSYTATAEPAEAVYGVYLPETPTVYPYVRTRKSSPKPRRAAARGNPNRASQEEPESESDEDEDEFDALRVAATACLNLEGRRPEGTCVCPPTWFIHEKRPPHVCPMAYARVTEGVRRQHRKWLIDLRAAPANLKDWDLADAALEMVRQRASLRGWCWATVNRNLGHIAGALSKLPLYTNCSEKIDLRDSVQWVAATEYAKRQTRSAIAYPPPPATLESVKAAREELERASPKASLFLQLMWSAAGRVGDIAHLQKRDVVITPLPREDGTYGVALIMRRGKGAKMRGTYTVPTTLKPQDASTLANLLSERRGTERIFRTATIMKDQVRAALKRQDDKLTLPSVRRGAVQHLGKQGVSERELMTMTGHTRVTTLRRYLGDGLPLSAEAAAAQDSAALLHQEQTNLGIEAQS